MTGSKPLAGVRVLELGGPAGAIAGRVLAGFGALAQRIEPPTGDPYGPHPVHAVSPRYGWYALDKEIAVLDVARQPEDLAALLPAVDILLIDDSPAPVGLDRARIASEFPHLIVVGVSHHGQRGPYAGLPGSSLTSLALGGLLALSAPAGESPLAPPVELADSLAGIDAALEAIARLAARGSDGPGSLVDCSVADSVVAANAWALARHAALESAAPDPRLDPDVPVLRAGDGFVRVAIAVPEQWRAFCAWLEDPDDLAGDEWLDPSHRSKHLQTIENVFRRERGYKDRTELINSGREAGVSIAAVLSLEEIAADQHFGERLALAGTVVPELGGMRVPRTYARIGPSAPDAPGPPRRVPRLSAGSRANGLEAIDIGTLRVLEMGGGAVGAEAGHRLARLGANVVTIERPAHPGVRGASEGGAHGFAFAHEAADRGKRSLSVDLKTPGGRAITEALIGQADILILTDATDVLAALSVDQATLAARFPRLIIAGSELMGAGAAGRPGFGATCQATGGISELWAEPGDARPRGLPAPFPAHAAGATLAAAALACLMARQRSGEGTVIDLSQAEFAMALLGEAFIELSLTGTSERRGRNHPAYAPYGIYECATPGAPIAVAVETAGHWQALKAALGEPDWATEPGLESAEGRVAARDTVDAEVGAWTAGLPRRVALARLHAAGVPAMPVLKPHELSSDPHLAASGALCAIRTASGIALLLDGGDSAPAPALGADTADILDEWLGREQVERLIAAAQPAPSPETREAELVAAGRGNKKNGANGRLAQDLADVLDEPARPARQSEDDLRTLLDSILET